jgi:hypothetical protein
MARTSGNKGGGVGGSGLLACVQYAPSSLATYNCKSLSLIAVDTTHLTIPFTVPASGNVLVKLSALCNEADNSNMGMFALFTHGTSSQVGDTFAVVGYDSSLLIVVTATFYITGLTPGTHLQYDWAYATTSTVNGLFVYVSGHTGVTGAPFNAPATMEVWSA